MFSSSEFGTNSFRPAALLMAALSLTLTAATTETCNEELGYLSFLGINMATSFERNSVSILWDAAVLVSNGSSPIQCDEIYYDVFVGFSPYNFSETSIEDLIQDPLLNRTTTTGIDLRLDTLQGGETYSILVLSNADGVLSSSNREGVEVAIAKHDPVLNRNVTRFVGPIEPSEAFQINISHGNGTTITFSGEIPPDIQALQASNHIAGSTSSGEDFLLHIESINVSPDFIAATVTEATLTDIYEELDFDLCFDGSRQLAEATSPDSRRLQSQLTRTFGRTIVKSLGPLTLTLTAELSAYFRIQIKIVWEWFVPRLTARASLGGQALNQILLEFEASAQFEQDGNIELWGGPTFIVPLPFFPAIKIFLTPSLTLEGSVSAELSAKASVELSQRGLAKAEVKYDRGWGADGSSDFSQSLDTNLEGKASATADLGLLLALDILVYNTFGIQVGVKGGIKWEGEAQLLLPPGNFKQEIYDPPFQLTKFDVSAFVEFPVQAIVNTGDGGEGVDGLKVIVAQAEVPLLTLPEPEIFQVDMDPCVGDDAMVLKGRIDPGTSDLYFVNSIQAPHIWAVDFDPPGDPATDPAAEFWDISPPDGELFVMKLPRSSIGTIPMYKLPTGNIVFRTTPDLPPLSKSLLTSKPIGNLFTLPEFECCQKEDCDRKYRDDEHVCRNMKCVIPSFCKDTDDGNDPNQEGTIGLYDDDACTELLQGTEQKDHCIDEYYLLEYFCVLDDYISTGCTEFATIESEEIQCEFGCDVGNGRCKVPSCFDSDMGKNEDQKGTVTLFSDNMCTEQLQDTMPMMDHCLDEYTLVEYYCSLDGFVAGDCTTGARVSSDEVYCEFGCDDGKCGSPFCSDSDGGTEKYERGTAALYTDNNCADQLDGATEMEDYCLDDDILVEYFCASDGIVTGGCSNGAIVNSAEIGCEFGCDNGRCCHEQHEGSCGGDPHFHNWHGEYFGYHGICDLVLVHNSRFGYGLGMDIHIRTQQREGYSSISNVALRIGTDVLEIVNDGSVFMNGVINSNLQEKLAGTYTVTKNVATESSVFFPDVSHGFTKTELGESILYDVSLHYGDSIQIQAWKDYLWVNVRGGEKHFRDSVGLMGKWGEPGKIARDGRTRLEDPNEYGMEWQVLATEPKLFYTARAPQYPDACLPAPPALEGRRLGQERWAQEACAHVKGPKKEFCVFDVVMTGDIDIAQVYHNTR